VDYGVPVADGYELGKVGSGVFFREYTKMNLTFNCVTQKADYAYFKADDDAITIVTAEDCSLNGQPAGGKCTCNPGWVGATCALLDRKPPLSRAAAAIAGSPTKPPRPGSTWGGNVLVDEKTGEHHLFVRGHSFIVYTPLTACANTLYLLPGNRDRRPQRHVLRADLVGLALHNRPQCLQERDARTLREEGRRGVP